MKHIDKSVPCYNCAKRSAGCHSYCEDYKAFDEANRARIEMIRQKKSEDRIVQEIKARVIKKIHKRDEG